MPSGLDSGGGWVNAPTDLPGFGDIQWESMSGRDTSRAMVGGDTWGADGTGYAPDTGFTRIATGIGMGEPIPGAAGAKTTDWRFLFNWEHNPTFWLLIFLLAAIGFIHARLRFGPAYARLG
jgi:hypothetical protein